MYNVLIGFGCLQVQCARDESRHGTLFSVVLLVGLFVNLVTYALGLEVIFLLLCHSFGLGKEAGVPDPKWSTIKRVWLPASLDLLNTVLGNVGLVWVAPSIYQVEQRSLAAPP